eukprot:649150-Hanusia_phi.AAC.2
MKEGACVHGGGSDDDSCGGGRRKGSGIEGPDVVSPQWQARLLPDAIVRRRLFLACARRLRPGNGVSLGRSALESCRAAGLCTVWSAVGTA